MKISIFLILCIHFCAQSQTKEIASKFQHKNLPYCISYSNIDSVSLNQIQTYSDADSLLLSKTLITKLSNPTKSNFGEQFGENIDSKYFADKFISKKKNFFTITFKRVLEATYESVENYICTIDLKGKCISKLLIASSIYNGTGSLEDGGRFPYYEQVGSCIQENLNITVDLGNGIMKKYKITERGEIIEFK